MPNKCTTNPTTLQLLTLDGFRTMNEIDRLIAMLEPSASENTVLFVRNELRNLIRGAWSNDYLPQHKLYDEVFPETEDDWSTTSQGERT